jgi:hypothetical protein
MVETNHAEERLARIEHLVDMLQRESTALKVMAGTVLIVKAGALLLAPPPIKH